MFNQPRTKEVRCSWTGRAARLRMPEKPHDQFVPFIDEGDLAPGCWGPDKIWKGKPAWRTRHGEAVVSWLLGEPYEAWSVRLADGSRSDVKFALGYQTHRRLVVGSKLWVHGSLEISPHDVLFVDGPQPTYAPPASMGDPNLEAELAADQQFCTGLADDHFAVAAYWALSNSRFAKGHYPHVSEFDDEGAAWLMANLRGLGEVYSDFTLSSWADEQLAHLKSDVTVVAARVRSALRSIGLAEGAKQGLTLTIAGSAGDHGEVCNGSKAVLATASAEHQLIPRFRTKCCSAEVVSSVPGTGIHRSHVAEAHQLLELLRADAMPTVLRVTRNSGSPGQTNRELGQ